ncbi:MAG: hypothetical protein ACOY45_05970 [Pseudomonadota bacterium]
MATALVRTASWMARLAIVLALLAMLPFSLLAFAAAGPTLSDPDASGRVGSTILCYLALDLLVLLFLPRLHMRRWAWMIAGCLAFGPAAILFLQG